MSNFFDKIKDGVNSAAIKSKEYIDLNRVKAQLNATLQQRKINIEEVGSAVYLMNQKGCLDEGVVKGLCGGIEKIDRQIEELQASILRMQIDSKNGKEEITRQVRCKCGESMPEETKYCGRCGSKIGAPPDPSLQANSAVQKCDCGTPIEPHAKFCGKCGKTVTPLA